MIKTTYKISKMDCPSEENLIRMKLEGLSEIKKLKFDLEKRVLTVIHSEKNAEITTRLEELDLGSSKLETTDNYRMEANADEKSQSKLLWIVLIINFGFFIIEMTTGLISKSMGLVADSLDMLADAVVYGLSLWAVGALISRKKKVAKISGIFQIILASVGLIEILRRFFFFEEIPNFQTMIFVSLFALIGNTASLIILQKSKSKEVHMKASIIFTANDVIINIGVILAGGLVYFTNSKFPDLIVGIIVFGIVVRGALRILKLS